ncbi:CBN-EGL-26 protein [Caenorhabditis brenneri]|uniref:CBN-EGL-26 protein n=1 Tax=Caenorhabditis brenneri TaxID=135651 RepID=G0N4L9_CAEBE|nr:CBN-EGL-26 protein [Caenorhabditis brenneri]
MSICIQPSSSSIGGYGKADDNVRILLMASVRNEFGDSSIFTRLGVTALGQHYVLVTKKKMFGGYTTHMITANMRNRPFISIPFKVSSRTQSIEESRDLIDLLTTELSRPGMFSFDEPPSGCQFPVGKEWIQLDEVPVDVHNIQDKYLEKGDEIFCEVNVSGVKFYHSGIYAGDGMVYHFVCDPQESESLAEALAVFSGVSAHVVFDTWFEYVYALVEVSDVPPRIFRASHPLICRSGDQIVKHAQHLQQELESYDIRRCNCQHFSSECSSGVAFSYDMTSNFKYFACSVLKPTSTVVNVMTRSNRDRSSFASNSTSS